MSSTASVAALLLTMPTMSRKIKKTSRLDLGVKLRRSVEIHLFWGSGFLLTYWFRGVTPFQKQAQSAQSVTAQNI